MSAYDSFLDAEYDQYCQERDLAERDFLQEEIADLELTCRETWTCIQFYKAELDKAIDLMDDEAASEASDVIAYETALLRATEREIAQLEEELAYLRC